MSNRKTARRLVFNVTLATTWFVAGISGSRAEQSNGCKAVEQVVLSCTNSTGTTCSSRSAGGAFNKGETITFKITDFSESDYTNVSMLLTGPGQESLPNRNANKNSTVSKKIDKDIANGMFTGQLSISDNNGRQPHGSMKATFTCR
jgi:hypothetical protein